MLGSTEERAVEGARAGRDRGVRRRQSGSTTRNCASALVRQFQAAGAGAVTREGVGAGIRSRDGGGRASLACPCAGISQDAGVPAPVPTPVPAPVITAAHCPQYVLQQ